jgi:hypothetical protein
LTSNDLKPSQKFCHFLCTKMTIYITLLLPARYNTFVFMVLQKSFVFLIASNYQLRGDMYSIHSCCWSATAYKWKVHERKIVIISFVASSSSTLTFSRHDRVDVKHKSLTHSFVAMFHYSCLLSVDIPLLVVTIRIPLIEDCFY